ncbi:MAG: carboxylating nicotinate-nucleotide diphosphorylase [Rubrobacteridae bacterium]|nr:carboxylating nicotinate-nucleotide diphosphorylase [Rubrobacteridae bacterium]
MHKFTDKLDREIHQLVSWTLEEDLGDLGDVTSKSTIDFETNMTAEMIVKSPGIIAGMHVAKLSFSYIESAIDFIQLVDDGNEVEPDTRIATINGSARALLSAERTALNFLQHLSGIATETSKYVKAISGTNAVLLDTRKTTPGLRYLEKYATAVGGAKNHRFGLFDQVLIKDNHIKAAGGIRSAVRKARSFYPNLKVEVEVETIDELMEALEAKADIIMLDNMKSAMLKKAVSIVNGAAVTEASGGVTLSNITSIAATGVDYISTGAITQAAKPLDISMEVVS